MPPDSRYDTQSEGQAIGREARNMADQVRTAAEERLEKQKVATGERLGSFARALKKASDELQSDGQTFVSRLLGSFGGQVDTLSQTLSNKKPEEIIASLRDFGRQNPTALIGGAVLTGLALGRFARSSGRRSMLQDRGDNTHHGEATSGEQPEYTISSSGADTPKLTEPKETKEAHHER